MHEKFFGKMEKCFGAFMDLGKVYDRIDRDGIVECSSIVCVGSQTVK